MTALHLLDHDSGGKGSSIAARRIHSMLLRRLDEVGQEVVAESLGVSASTVSRFKTENLERVSQVLAALGLKVIPADTRQFDEATVSALLTLAAQRLAQIRTVADLDGLDQE